MARREALKALVLQGGGALGAYELGVARALYRERVYVPDLIAGVSIGAVTAALLARPKSGDALGTLEEFWCKVALPADFLLPPSARMPRCSAIRPFSGRGSISSPSRSGPAFMRPRRCARP